MVIWQTLKKGLDVTDFSKEMSLRKYPSKSKKTKQKESLSKVVVIGHFSCHPSPMSDQSSGLVTPGNSIGPFSSPALWVKTLIVLIFFCKDNPPPPTGQLHS